jgi:hypothetical protein
MSSVLDRIRQAAAKAASGSLADARERPRFERVAAQSPFPPDATPEDYLARFRTELEALTGKVYGPFDAEEVAAQLVPIIEAAAGRSAQPRRPEHTKDGGSDSPLPLGEGQGEGSPQPPIRVLSWDPAEIGCPGLEERLREAAIDLVQGEVPNDENHQRVLEEYAELTVGLSGALAGLADTGSIVVASGPGRPRIASLLSLVHIAILPVDSLYPTMHDWLTGGGSAVVGREANVSVITGSSRTSDIELQLTLGMHGPKEIHVVLMK